MADPRAVTYIKNNLEKGFSIAEIKQKLKDAGWPDYMIEQAFLEATNKETIRVPEKPKVSNLGAVVVVILLLIACSVAGYFLYGFIKTALQEQLTENCNPENCQDPNTCQDDVCIPPWQVVNTNNTQNNSGGTDDNNRAGNSGGGDDGGANPIPIIPVSQTTCGNNIDCFINASSSCTPTNLTYVSYLTSQDSIVTTNFYSELRGKESGNCTLYSMLFTQRFNFTELGIQAQLARGMTMQEILNAVELVNSLLKLQDGKDAICGYENNGEITAFFQDIKNSIIDITGLNKDKCQGTLVSLKLI